MPAYIVPIPAILYIMLHRVVTIFNKAQHYNTYNVDKKKMV